MDRSKSVVTPERFPKGMTFDEYVRYVATPENLAREASMKRPRRDWSTYLRATYEATRLHPAQVDALKWLAAQPGGPAKVLVISEEWSSDCRRDVPMLARMAETVPFELRIFRRDGQRYGESARPTLAEAPDSNADIMAEFLNDKNGQTWQSIPVAVFYTRDLKYLYHYVEYPAIYHKDDLLARVRSARPGESAEQTRERAEREFVALQQGPFFKVWACAGIDEIIAGLHERFILGAPGAA